MSNAVTSIYWPAGLPQIPVMVKGDKISRGIPDNININQKPETGPPLTRPTSSAFYRPFTIPLVLKTYDEADLLDDFYLFTLVSGTQPFIWEGWVRKGSSTFIFDLSKDPPEPVEIGNGVHKVNLHLIQYPEEAV